MIVLAVLVVLFLGQVAQAAMLAWRLHPDLLSVVAAFPHPTAVAVTVALLAGVSQLLGQSVVLFVNRVRPGRFVASLFLNGLLFVDTLVVWALASWLVGLWAFGTDATPGMMIRIVCLGSAPFLFGFLALIPYLGTFLIRLLYVWSLLIVLRIVQATLDLGTWEAVACVGSGWLLVMLINATVGRPVVEFRRRLRQRVAGTSLAHRPQDILSAYLGEAHDATGAGTDREASRGTSQPFR